MLLHIICSNEGSTVLTHLPTSQGQLFIKAIILALYLLPLPLFPAPFMEKVNVLHVNLFPHKLLVTLRKPTQVLSCTNPEEYDV